MKIEMCEDSRIAIVLTCLIVLASVVILGGCHEYETTKREAIKAGLVESQLGGTTQTHWTKP